MRRLRPGCGCYEHQPEPGRAVELDDVRAWCGSGTAPDGSLFSPAARQGSGRCPRLAGAGADNERRQGRSTAQTALQVALTSEGLRALEVAPDLCAEFSAEFVAGMASDAARARRLGDVGASDPGKWLWGAGSGYRTSPCSSMPRPGGWRRGSGRSKRNTQPASCASTPVDVRYAGRGAVRICRRHFTAGGRLGAQTAGPRPGSARVRNVTCLGEFLLGYPNEYGLYTPRPLMAPQRDPRGLLPRAEDAPDQADLGRNGSYLVLRQLQQDVQGFWRESIGKPEAMRTCASGWPRRWSAGRKMANPLQRQARNWRRAAQRRRDRD